MIKKTGADNQSDEHFILTRLVADVAESQELDVKISDYGKNADVVISNSYGNTAGFEIEMNTNNNSDLLNKVDRLNESKDLDTWFFVTADGDKQKYQKYHNNTISFAEVQNTITKFANSESE